MTDIDLYAAKAASYAIYPSRGTGSWDELSYLGLGLGEAGELQGKISKLHRDGYFDREAVAKELGDVFWFACLLARALDYDPSEILAENLAKLESRSQRGCIGGSGDDR